MRPFQYSDTDDVHVWLSDPEVMRYFAYPPHIALQETVDRIRLYREESDRLGFGRYLVVERATGRSIGDAGLRILDETKEVHVGYRFAKSSWGRGYATEAAQAWIDFGFATLRLERITGFAHPENAASIKVLIKAGLTFCRKEPINGIDWGVYEVFRPPCGAR
jgi:RimJ/RimL family protein N-acetyltransferase